MTKFVPQLRLLTFVSFRNFDFCGFLKAVPTCFMFHLAPNIEKHMCRSKCRNKYVSRIRVTREIMTPTGVSSIAEIPHPGSNLCKVILLLALRYDRDGSRYPSFIRSRDITNKYFLSPKAILFTIPKVKVFLCCLLLKLQPDRPN